jgi:FG-GAP-like repeat
MSRRFVFSISFILVRLIAASAQVKFSTTSYNSGDFDTNSLVTGDFNNDGILDLVTINTSSLSFYKGLGGGKFANARQQSIPGCSSQALPADLNRDGKLDLALVCGSDQIMIFFGNGDGTFTNGPTLATSNYAYTIALQISTAIIYPISPFPAVIRRMCVQSRFSSDKAMALSRKVPPFLTVAAKWWPEILMPTVIKTSLS